MAATVPSTLSSSWKSGLTSNEFSHSTMDAARSHRERLSGSGVSNAYVQSATANGRQTYRVRVGPFTSREAAQAAQTRLRGLGEGGFISAN